MYQTFFAVIPLNHICTVSLLPLPYRYISSRIPHQSPAATAICRGTIAPGDRRKCLWCNRLLEDSLRSATPPGEAIGGIVPALRKTRFFVHSGVQRLRGAERRTPGSSLLPFGQFTSWQSPQQGVTSIEDLRQIRTTVPGDCHGRKRPRNDSGLLVAGCVSIKF